MAAPPAAVPGMSPVAEVCLAWRIAQVSKRRHLRKGVSTDVSQHSKLNWAFALWDLCSYGIMRLKCFTCPAHVLLELATVELALILLRARGNAILGREGSIANNIILMV
eukprot:408026-Amphidinium_carterae.2